MTVSALNAYSGSFTGNGATTAFPFTFSAASTAEVTVLVNGVDTATGYTITLNANQASNPGGTVTFSVAPANGVAIIIESDPSFAQDIAFTDAGPFLAESHDEALDDAARRDIYLKERLGRAVMVDRGETPLSVAGLLASVGSYVPDIVFTRAALAVTAATTTSARYLAESGREGAFVFSSANLSAMVTADPNQGVYVAPASAPTGASGAWVRKFSGPHSVRWFGATGDGATNDGAAVAAAIAYLGSQAQTGLGYSSSASELFFPKGHYYLGTNTLDLTYTVVLTGEGMGGAGGAASLLRWAVGTTGIRVQRANTTGATAIQASSGHGGDGSIIRNLYLKGGFTTTEGEFHGIHLRATATIRDCFIEAFQGDGIYAKATIGGGAGSEGACNLIEVSKIFVQTCRNGIYTEGADANAGNISSFSAIACRQWGIFDKSFLGNTYIAPHVAACGRNSWNTGGAAAPASFVSHGGNRYTVVRGQESGASTNAPTGAATNNTWWIWMEAGAADAPSGVVTWTNGFTFRAGGGYIVEGLSNSTAMVNPYGEIDQYSQFDQNATILGNRFLQGHIKVSVGVVGANQVASFGASLTGYRFSGGVEVLGDGALRSVTNSAGPQSGTAADSTFSVDNTNAISQINFRNWVAGVPTTRGYIRGLNATLGVDIGAANGAGQVRLQVNNVDIAAVSSTGLAVAGTSLSTGATGYATGAGGAVTQATSKATGVTLNKVAGQITLNNAALASAAKVSFVVTNSTIAATDVVIPSVASGGTANAYRAAVTAVAAGSFTLTVENITAGSLSEAPVINFAKISAVAA